MKLSNCYLIYCIIRMKVGEESVFLMSCPIADAVERGDRDMVR